MQRVLHMHDVKDCCLRLRRSPAVKEAMARARAEEGYNPELTKGEVEMPGNSVAAEPLGVEVAKN